MNHGNILAASLCVVYSIYRVATKITSNQLVSYTGDVCLVVCETRDSSGIICIQFNFSLHYIIIRTVYYYRFQKRR